MFDFYFCSVFYAFWIEFMIIQCVITDKILFEGLKETSFTFPLPLLKFVM